ncbi:MAG: CDP-alcohol phosphatidyltransferase family protein [Candidatus Diapherotrites archaeon]|nr:CDP-alcohol phosphatidyltransferase family protein [Candidatus Diapherotrites archaeon]
MISARFRKYSEPVMRRIARHFSYLPPNFVTLLSILVAIGAAYMFAQQRWFAGGILALVASFLDALDGAIARLTGKTSKWGSYLDAVVDRYVEGILFFGIGLGTGLWPWVYLAMLGALLISYAKARAAMETEVDNINWPDLMERAERLIMVSVLFPVAAFYGYAEEILILMVVLFHFTAIQRILRVYRMLG